MKADEAGRFRIEHVTPGSYQLSACRPDSPGDDPFTVIGDMRRSQTEIGVADGESYEFTLRIDFAPR